MSKYGYLVLVIWWLLSCGKAGADGPQGATGPAGPAGKDATLSDPTVWTDPDGLKFMYQNTGSAGAIDTSWAGQSDATNPCFTPLGDLKSGEWSVPSDLSLEDIWDIYLIFVQRLGSNVNPIALERNDKSTYEFYSFTAHKVLSPPPDGAVASLYCKWIGK